MSDASSTSVELSKPKKKKLTKSAPAKKATASKAKSTPVVVNKHAFLVVVGDIWISGCTDG